MPPRPTTGPRSGDPYAGDILGGHERRRARVVPELPADRDLVVEDAATGFCGAVLGVEKTGRGDAVRLEDARGATRLFLLHPAGFLVDGAPVTLVRPRPAAAPAAPRRSASGSTVVEDVRARTALPSRIWVEGVHDAALVERVWGHDLRVEGVVVEQIEGLDNLPAWLAEFRPGPGRRVGVLVDHLVTGSKESRLTRSLGEHVMVTGHPYVDVWQAVRPASLGIAAWPAVPRGEDWKTGVCARLGWSDPRDGWRRVQGAVRTFRDLEPAMIGAVERLVDFVTEPG